VTAFLAAHFFAGSLLTLLMPLGLVVIVVVYYSFLMRRDARRKVE
jgi:hypothetical protein